MSGVTFEKRTLVEALDEYIASHTDGVIAELRKGNARHPQIGASIEALEVLWLLRREFGCTD